MPLLRPGPVGRQAQAATDAKLEAEIVSYSRSRGLFAGVSLDGTVLNADARTNASYRKNPEVDDKKLAALKTKLLELGSTKVIEAKAGSHDPAAGRDPGRAADQKALVLQLELLE